MNSLTLSEVKEKGRKLSICPYYAIREAIPLAQLIILPSICLLQESIRKSLNLDLNGMVCVFDESHHLISTINQLYSPLLTLKSVIRNLSID